MDIYRIVRELASLREDSRFGPGIRWEARYTEHGASASGYGASIESARESLAATLAFNLEHNGKLV